MLVLAAEGLANAGIAERLYLSGPPCDDAHHFVNKYGSIRNLPEAPRIVDLHRRRDSVSRFSQSAAGRCDGGA